jgi:hypothetical protein
MIRIFPTEYTVNDLSEDDVNSAVWSIKIEWRGGDRWAITHIGRCLSRKGKWDMEPSPSNRTESWLTRHRFTLEEAQDKAVEIYPDLIVNGYWVRDGKVVPVNNRKGPATDDD